VIVGRFLISGAKVVFIREKSIQKACKTRKMRKKWQKKRFFPQKYLQIKKFVVSLQA